MVREGHKHGGSGWLKYDCIFRKNNAGSGASWDVLDPSLLTIVANQGYNPRSPCHHCQELDHGPRECTLAPLEKPSKWLPPQRPATYARSAKRPIPYDSPSPYTNRYSPVTSQDPGGRGPTRPRICISWNKGLFAYQGACSYAQVCPTCDTDTHRARDCPKTAADSIFNRSLQTRQ